MFALRLGLTVAAMGFLIVTIASSRAGYPMEIALVRGLLAFMALSFVAYLGELVIATSSLPNAAAADGDGREGTDGGEIAVADDQAEGLTERPDDLVRLPESNEVQPAA